MAGTVTVEFPNLTPVRDVPGPDPQVLDMMKYKHMYGLPPDVTIDPEPLPPSEGEAGPGQKLLTQVSPDKFQSRLPQGLTFDKEPIAAFSRPVSQPTEQLTDLPPGFSFDEHPQPQEKTWLLAPVKEVNGKMQWAVPGIVKEAWDDLKGFIQTGDEKAAVRTVGRLFGMAYGRAGAGGLATESELGIFGGTRKAAEMPTESTKYHVGADTLPRFEISDKNMSWIENPKITKIPASRDLNAFREKGAMVTISRDEYKLSNLIKHDELFKQYPEAANIRVVPTASMKRGEATFYDANNSILMNPRDIGGELGRPILLHEIQHWVQGQEGFAKGGSMKGFNLEGMTGIVEDISKALKNGRDPTKAFEKVPQAVQIQDSIIEGLRGLTTHNVDKFTGTTWKEAIDFLKYADDRWWKKEGKFLPVYAATNNYKKLAGEVEARNVEKRMSMDEQTRASIPPIATEDVARYDQIIVQKLSKGDLAKSEPKTPPPVDDVVKWLKDAGVNILSVEKKGGNGTTYIKFEDPGNPKIPGSANMTVRIPEEGGHRAPYVKSSEQGNLFDTGYNFTPGTRVRGNAADASLNVSGGSYSQMENLIDALKWRLSRSPDGNFLISPGKEPRARSAKAENTSDVISKDPNQRELDFSAPIALADIRARAEAAASELPKDIIPRWQQVGKGKPVPNEMVKFFKEKWHEGHSLDTVARLATEQFKVRFSERTVKKAISEEGSTAAYALSRSEIARQIDDLTYRIQQTASAKRRQVLLDRIKDLKRDMD